MMLCGLASLYMGAWKGCRETIRFPTVWCCLTVPWRARMILNIFTVFDDKAKAYLPPFFLPAIPMAVRAFSDCVSDPNHAFGRHPEDYVLFHCGTFDDNIGVAFWSDSLTVIGRGLQFVRVQGEILPGSSRGGAL